MKYSVALLIASANAIHISGAPVEPIDNTCINVRQDTGLEEPCNAPGNSAWEMDRPVQTAEELGLTKGFLGTYWFFQEFATAAGYSLEGIEPAITDLPTQTVMFENTSAFASLQQGFPYTKFQCVWAGQFSVENAGDYYFSTTSDDGSRLWIDHVLVVDNWGTHGAIKKTTKVSLNKGWHTVGTEMFQSGGGGSMALTYAGPDTLNQAEVPLEAWY